MTRFIYIADTHMGANPMLYQQQQGYPEQLPAIIAKLNEFIAHDAGIDFVLHGGDILDSVTEDNIAAARESFSFEVPFYLCLGNHDLTTPDSLDLWLNTAPQLFPGGSANFTITREDCSVHVVPNQWCITPYYWKSEQSEHFLPQQLDYLSKALDVNPELPQLLLTHSPVYGLPPEQTGFPEPYHAPNKPFTEQLSSIAESHPSIKCVLGAHNHMNMRATANGTDYITVSALAETPFDFKVIEVSSEQLSVQTISLQPQLGFGEDYNESRAFVQGRPSDRNFSKTIHT